ncbi:MAG: glycosyltransferase family 2 protein [Candidatus ainarchaeum sp.]|nr:glycosyltransferase family 2 protein [Candidatus ainarchaeum sp.]
MSLNVKGEPRPALTLLVIIAIGIIVGIVIRSGNYFWLMVIPNTFALALTFVILFAYNAAGSYEKSSRKRLPDLSVIIPSYNSKSTIFKTLDAVKASKYPGKMEVIVVDDGSTDGSRELLKTAEGIRLLVLEKNRGKAGAINIALKGAKGEVVACVDSDSYPEPDAFAEAVSVLMEDSGIGVVSCFVKVANPNNLLKKFQEIEFMTGFGFFQIGVHFLDAISVAPGPTSIFRKSALEKVGGFDEHNITEDLEIVWRLRKNGYRIGHTPHAVIYTEVPGDLGSLFKQRIRWYRGIFYNVQKHADLLFNPKYGLFSMLVLPFSFAGEFAGVALSFSFAYITLAQLAWGAQYVWAAFSIGAPFSMVSAGPGVSAAAVVMGFMLVCPWILVVYLSYAIGGRDIGILDIPVILLFFLFYGPLISLFYCITFLKEVNRSDYTWK